MLRLPGTTKKNTSREYDRIFQERAKKGTDWQDVRRWKALIKYYHGGDLVDAGCLDSEIYKFRKWDRKNRYWGYDLATEPMMVQNQRHGSPLEVHFGTGDVYGCGLYRSSYDYCVLGEVLEHLEEPEKAVKEAFRILKSCGVLAISVPLEEAREPGAVDKDRHLWSFTKDDILNLVKPYSSRTRTKVLRSKWFPRYKYCWPQLIVWSWKK